MKKAAQSRSEKDLLSTITKMFNYSEYIHANLVDVKRKCGNKNCRCNTKDQKHLILYLATVKKDDKIKMIYIPKRLEKRDPGDGQSLF